MMSERLLIRLYAAGLVIFIVGCFQTGVTLPALLAYLVIAISVPLNWYVTYRLWREARGNRGVRVLHERAVVATALAVIVSVFALIFVNNGLPQPWIDQVGTMLITRSAILGLSLPALYWLWLYGIEQ